MYAIRSYYVVARRLDPAVFPFRLQAAVLVEVGVEGFRLPFVGGEGFIVGVPGARRLFGDVLLVERFDFSEIVAQDDAALEELLGNGREVDAHGLVDARVHGGVVDAHSQRVLSSYNFV